MFVLLKERYVSLEVFDILGRKIQTLEKGESRPGKYAVSFDGSQLPSGVYFYRLNAGEFIQSKRMILAR
ncbi:MAG: hypothetical protein AUI33_01785 [Ignavibacteria bacterium 13_1_40CM_2_61_4]|nr:MAG: hypothetical protein AUI33_01785 [Ignavibacteria bacterium 13_1_40CM_2_61_4]